MNKVRMLGLLVRDHSELLIDKEDLKKFYIYPAYVCGGYLYIKYNESKYVSFSRLLMEFPAGLEVDHINKNKLDNRKENLRSCKRSENLRNIGVRSDSKSGYKGVYWDSSLKLWRAAISIEGRRYKLGTFSSPEQAALRYNKAAEECHGNFAHLNEIT